MSNNLFIDTLEKGFESFGLSISDEKINLLARFNEMMVDSNKHMNLTAVTDDVESAKKHFLDSINPPIMALINARDSIIDVGSGAGFPGIPLAIACNDVRFTLLDTRQKRCEFLQLAVDELQLSNVKIIWDRAEVLGKSSEHREMYDIATARAVAGINVLSEYLLPFVKIGGTAAMYKLDGIDDEINSGKSAVELLGGGINAMQSYTIIGENRKQAILCVKKISQTPIKYPRKSGLPTKRPL